MQNKEVSEITMDEFMAELSAITIELKLLVFAMEHQGELSPDVRREIPTVGERICDRMGILENALISRENNFA